jgi:hypothetical protein
VLQEVRDGFRPLVVGDGINDSLALKVGAVDVATGAQGTDVAPASAAGSGIAGAFDVIRLLTLLCCLLAGAVAADISYRPEAEIHAGNSTAAPLLSAGQAGKESDAIAASRDACGAVVLVRPLFAPDRRPVAGSVIEDPGMPRLTGIIASPAGAVAIFQAAGGTQEAAGDPRRVRVWTNVARPKWTLPSMSSIACRSPDARAMSASTAPWTRSLHLHSRSMYHAIGEDLPPHQKRCGIYKPNW